MSSYRRVSEASAPNSRVYFQVSGIKHAGTSTTLKLKLSEDSPISALFAHIDGAVERSRPPSSKYDRIPKPAQYRWHNMVLTPEVDGHRTPMALGMRCGENNVVSIEVLYPVSSPRRYEQSPISARRNIMLDSENDVGYHSNLLVERSGGRTGPVGRASDMGDSYNSARNQSARRNRDASPYDASSSSRHSAGVRAGTHRSESADLVQRTVSDILSETLRVTHTTDGKYASSTSGGQQQRAAPQQAAATPQRQPLPPAAVEAVDSRANSQSPVGRQRGASMRDRPPVTKPVVGAGAASPLLPQRRQGDAAGGSFEPTSRPPGRSMVSDGLNRVSGAVASPEEAAPRDAYVEAPRATKHQNITPPRRYTDEYRLGHQSTSPAHARMSSPHEVRDHLANLIKKQHAEAVAKDEIIYAQQQELARLEAELGSISSNSKLSISTQNRRVTPQRSVTTPKTSPGRRTASSGARRHPDDETHYSALARSANRSLNTQAMDEEAKAEALALAIRNQQQQSASKAAARSGAGNTQFSKGSTIGSDTQYRHESQWSRSGRAISEEGSASQHIALDGIQDARHFSERARSPHHLHNHHQQSPDQRTSPPRRRGDNTLQSPVAPTQSISTPQQEDLPTASLSSSGAVPQDVMRVLQTQERTISSQQQTLLRLEAEMQKLMAANARLVDDTKSSSSPVPVYQSPKRVPISISPSRNGGGASTAAATPVRQGNNSQSRNYALYTDPQEEVAALTIAVAASEREKAIREMSPPRGSAAGGDESVPHSIHSSPVAKPLSNASTDGTADSVIDIRQQQGVIDAQQQQLVELEQQLAKLRATSATSALLKNEDTYSQKQSEARRSLLTSVTETSPTASNQHHHASSPASPSRGPAAVQHAPATPPSRQVREPSTNQSPQQQQNHYQATPTTTTNANHNNNNMGNVSNLSNVSQTQDDSVHASRMRATALENSYLMRKVQIQEHASKDADSRIALLERQLKSQQEKLETTRRQNETLKAEVEERKRAPRGALDGKTLPGIVPSPYLYHVPARDAAEASQRIQDFKVSSPHGVSSHQHGAVDESFRSLPDDGSLSPITPHDSSYTPQRNNQGGVTQHQQQYGMSTPTGANGTVTPVFTQSLSASKYHGDQLTSSRKTNAAPSSTSGVPATDRTPTVNGTPARKQPPPPPAARK